MWDRISLWLVEWILPFVLEAIGKIADKIVAEGPSAVYDFCTKQIQTLYEFSIESDDFQHQLLQWIVSRVLAPIFRITVVAPEGAVAVMSISELDDFAKEHLTKAFKATYDERGFIKPPSADFEDEEYDWRDDGGG